MHHEIIGKNKILTLAQSKYLISNDQSQQSLFFPDTYDPMRDGDMLLLICAADNDLFHFKWSLSAMLFHFRSLRGESPRQTLKVKNTEILGGVNPSALSTDHKCREDQFQLRILEFLTKKDNTKR